MATFVAMNSHTTRGFTLVEMMVVVAIAAIVATAAAPSLSAALDSVKLSAASNELLSGMYLARGESIKRNSRVVLCKSADGENCTATGGWEQGWIIFQDTNNNALREGSELLLHREMPLSAGMRLTGNQNVARYISFAPTGATKMVGGGFQAGTLTICKHSFQSGEARQIILNAVGRPRVQKTEVGSCG